MGDHPTSEGARTQRVRDRDAALDVRPDDDADSVTDLSQIIKQANGTNLKEPGGYFNLPQGLRWLFHVPS